jgi:hypothetical protein
LKSIHLSFEAVPLYKSHPLKEEFAMIFSTDFIEFTVFAFTASFILLENQKNLAE